MKVGLPLMKNTHTLLAKSLLVPIGLTAAASAVDAGIHKKKLGSGAPGSRTVTWIISNKKMSDIRKIAKFLKDSDLLIKGITQTIKVK